MIEANAGKLHKITTVRYEEGTKFPSELLIRGEDCGMHQSEGRTGLRRDAKAL
jgi:hypothetical protein